MRKRLIDRDLSRVVALSAVTIAGGGACILLIIWWLSGDVQVLPDIAWGTAVAVPIIAILCIMFHAFGARRRPLHLAAAEGDLEKVDSLIQRGRDIDARTKYGWTPLHEAAGFGRYEVVAYLISKGAQINATDKKGQTPLHWAAFHGDRATVELLVSHGADVNAVNDENETPSDRAGKNGHTHLTDLLHVVSAVSQTERGS